MNPPDAVIVPEMMIPVSRIDAKRRSWLFHGRLVGDGAGTQRTEHACPHHTLGVLPWSPLDSARV